MNAPGSNIFFQSVGRKGIGLLFLFTLLIGGSVYAQNTKGDKPATQSREGRFSTPFKKKTPKRKTVSTKRVRPKESFASRAGSSSSRKRASGTDRPGKPIRPLSGTQPETKQRAWTGDIAGYRLRHKNRSSAGNSRKNIYPQYGRYANVRPRSTETPTSNKGTLAQLKRLQTQEGPTPRKNRRVAPRSASRSFTARKSTNVYANFARPKKKGERATTTDLAGRPLRKRNFETPRTGVVSPLFKPYVHRGAMGDKAYKGRVTGGYLSATRGPRAWRGDIAGRRIRGRNFTSKKSIEGKPDTGPVNNLSATKGHPGKYPLPPKAPGIGALGINRFRGNTRAGRPLKGGGSVSGRLWNNNAQPLVVRTPAQGAQAALFQGRIRARKPLTGGGSVSGKLWNNNGQPLVVRTPTQGARAAFYQGNIKTKRPERGMPNVAGSLPRKGLPAGSEKISGYPGKLKRFEVQPGFSDMGETFTGYIKLKKFRKTYVQHPDAADESIKKRRVKKSAFDAEGLLVKVKRPDYIQNKNAADGSLLKQKPSKSSIDAGELQVRVKQKEYGKKPHAAEGTLAGIKPSKTSVKANEYARSVKRNWDYIHNPSSSDEALKTREPGKAFAKVSAYQGNIKMQKYALFERNRNLHPDTKFIKTNKNNVDEERDMLTNFKLWWARLFKKEDTQPDNLKYKGKKPRYDKGEQGLWYE